MKKISELRGAGLLEKLSLTFGPSGCETLVADEVYQNISHLADEIIHDRSGSLIAVYKGTNGAVKSGLPKIKRLMLSAHMDEVGFMISSIDENGYLKMAPLSVRDPKVLVGKYVTVGDENSRFDGYIGAKPIHLLKEKGLPEYDGLYIDIGADCRETAEKYVPVGSFGTFKSDFVRFGKDGRMIKGKALDDRLGCAVLCDTLRYLRENNVPVPFDVYFAFTCREELGISGAVTAANLIRPDYAVIFEATAVSDVYGTPETSMVARQGAGAVVTLRDRGTIYDKELTNFILSAAEKRKIPYQIKKFLSGGNDSAGIQKTRSGVKCAAISAPARYIHTSSNVIREEDFFSIEKLAAAIFDEYAP